MPFSIQPATGVYRIKIAGKDEYLQRHSTDSRITVQSAPVDYSNTEQLWKVTALSTDTYNISSYQGGLSLTLPDANSPDLVLQAGGTTKWKLDPKDASSLLIPIDPYLGEVTWRHDRYWYRQNGYYLTWLLEQLIERLLCLIFELVEDDSQGISRFQSTYFTLTPQQALDQGPYDIIIIGAGYGGGVLAADLFETNKMVGDDAKKILVLERGQLVFHSHCLNSARPTGNRSGRDQFNHTFYDKFKDAYNVAPECADDWGGGPVYGVGGRSAVWSLAAPRPHDRTLYANFPAEIVNELLLKYYPEAEKLLGLFLPKTGPEHRDLMNRLNMTSPVDLGVAWEWARIASEFRDDRNFDFGNGAFSTIDKFVEIAMNKPVDKDGNFVEHENFKILLGAEARKIKMNNSSPPEPTHVIVNTHQGEITIPLNTNGRVVLSAGSVHSPAILLRSGITIPNGGLHLTDHNILVHNSSYRYRVPSERNDVGSLKLRSYLNLPGKGGLTDITLASLYIDSSPFLYRGPVNIASNDVPSLVTTFMMRTPLEQSNRITLDPDTQEPVITVHRTTFEKEYYKTKQAAMKDFNEKAKLVMSDVLNVDFLSDPQNEDYFQPLKLGAGCHEMGTLPIGTCLDVYHRLIGYKGIFVADNSVFPFVCEANPSLTLTALTLRLSRFMIRRGPLVSLMNMVGVLNHTGEWIQVAVSQTSNGAMSVDAPKELKPGGFRTNLTSAAQETVFVYKLDLAQDQSKGRVYLATPEFQTVKKNRIVSIT